MRVTQVLSPSFLHRIPSRAKLAAGMLCVALAASGCAGRSVLGEKPAATKVGAAEVVPEKGAQTTSVTQLQKFLWFFSPYRPVIQQGNFVSEEMLAQVKVGMTREQVRFIFGTPLLQDVFHGDRWDYPFRLAKGDGELTTSRVVVYFDKEGKVERFEGGNLPTEKEYIARIAGPAYTAPKADKPEVKAAPASAPLPAGTTPAETVPSAPVMPAPAVLPATQATPTTPAPAAEPVK